MGSGEPDARPSTWHDALFRLRGWLVIAIAVVLFLTLVATRGWQRPIRRDTFAAAPIVAAGIAIRVWARSYLLRGTNTRRVHARRIVVDGPYRRVRNPIYVGNMEVACGLALAFAGPIAAGVLLLLLFVLYSGVVHSEEAILRATFPERFDELAAKVPRWWPRLKAAAPVADPPVPEVLGALRSEMHRIAGASGAWGVALWLAVVSS